MFDKRLPISLAAIGLKSFHLGRGKVQFAMEPSEVRGYKKFNSDNDVIAWKFITESERKPFSNPYALNKWKQNQYILMGTY